MTSKFYVQRSPAGFFNCLRKEKVAGDPTLGAYPRFHAQFTTKPAAVAYCGARNDGLSHTAAVQVAVSAAKGSENVEAAPTLEERARKARTFNPGPKMPLASDAAPRAPKALETGLRYKVTATIANFQTSGASAARLTLHNALNSVFGGFTCARVHGGWRDENGADWFAPGIRYDVSFEKSADVELARQIFQDAGAAIGEQWVRIEVTSFQALHSKCA